MLDARRYERGWGPEVELGLRAPRLAAMGGLLLVLSLGTFAAGAILVLGAVVRRN